MHHPNGSLIMENDTHSNHHILLIMWLYLDNGHCLFEMTSKKKRTVTHYKWWTYDLNQKHARTHTNADTYREKRFKKRKYTTNNKNVDCHRLSGYIQRYFCVECKGNDPSRYAYTKKSKCHLAAWTLGTKMLETIDVSRNNINENSETHTYHLMHTANKIKF